MVDYSNWLRDVSDDTKLSTLSIPGTHNSAAYHMALPSVQCQDASITEQLENGVRFLDIRVSKNILHSDDQQYNLVVCHGKFPIKLLGNVELSEALDEVYKFLDSHRSETVIVSIKQEGSGTWDNDHDEFGNCIWDRYVNKNKDKWYLGTDIPKVGDTRGKAVLFRRFGVKDQQRKSQFGFEASWWTYNTSNDDRGNLQVQDWCEINKPEDIGTKANYVKEHIKRAVDYNSTNTDSQKLFVNFCSGSNFFDHECWPQKIAEGLDQDKIDETFGKGSGILVLDYAKTNDWRIVREYVNKNF
ncbi:1-phosphatidylinositol phosphodiesterase [Sugiyamaella lignohabitans]|uniref:1-phosphatidylinositol phosphodiesterase n=1 Tax=Sugiyamaella lignohabitans TaxID=796027 RepID=A0A161HKA8_9ASCO|nr:1-phosphatidylinositol phosphodiesterase [Sugiyamaella lignohabitans]ANB12048.1 1-phosphatidylinositol phosphodiesterase [Sugiyamaella lignohabitans]